jgi:dTDP-glucose 4,6-dehydratase
VKKALVTGSGGFIGHHLVRTLIETGTEVVCFLRYTSSASRGLLDYLPESMRNAYRPVFGDIRDPEILKIALEGCDTIFHLAALIGIPYSYICPSDVMSVNLGGTLNVLTAAEKTGAKVVVTSTSEVYGSAVDVPISENHPLNAQSPYAASKTAADQLALSFHAAYGLPVSICRPFNTYGPGQSQRAVIPSILTQAIFSNRVELGSLEPSRDFIYVSDTVAGFLALANCPEAIGRIVQFGTGREVTIEQLASMAVRAADRDGVEVISSGERKRPVASEVMRLVASNDLAHRLTGWKPLVPLEEGLVLTAAWIEAHPSLYRQRGYVL